MSLLKTNEIQNYNGSSLTLTASTVSTSAQLNTGGNISVTGSLNVSDDSTTRTNLGLGTIATQDSDSITVTGGTATLGALTVSGSDSGDLVRITQTGTGNALVVEDSTDPDSTPFLINASGGVCVGTTSPHSSNPGITIGNPDINGSSGEAGVWIGDNGVPRTSTDSSVGLYMNDSSSSAGTHNYISFRYQGSTIADIDTTDNTTLRYNTFTGGHWTQFEDGTQQNLPLGTVLSTVDDLLQWTEYEYTDENGQTNKTTVAGFDPIGETKTIYIDEDGATAEGTALSHDTARRIAKCKVSDVAGDKCVYGVFAGHYKDGDSSVESLGLGIIRIGSGVTVKRGDLLESAGDGTACPQTGDFPDLFKAGTIAKVTSTTIVETYDDGSYTVPCTLHCG